MKIYKNKNIRDYNSFKINATANTFIELSQEDDFIEFIRRKNDFPAPYYILGGGFNSLFKGDFKGTIIKISNKGITKQERGDTVFLTAKAGTPWNDVVFAALDEGLYGVENLIDIPGQAGSAPIQNIGAYGVEIKDSIDSVSFFDMESGEKHIFSNAQCRFGYRSSIFKSELKGKILISEISLRLSRQGEPKTDYGNIKKALLENNIINPGIKEIAGCISRIRAAKLPDPEINGNAGSFFKNPVVDSDFHSRLKAEFPNLVSFSHGENNYKIAAGWLIEQTGWKGKSMGNAAVHKNQALVLINKNGRASGDEITALADAVAGDVYSMFRIRLEPEVNII